MDGGGMSEGSLGEGSKVDKDDDEDESSDDGMHVPLMKRLGVEVRRMLKLGEKKKVMDMELEVRRMLKLGEKKKVMEMKRIGGRAIGYTPLRSFVGDPSTSVDVNQLYTAVSIREMNVHRVVSEIIGQSLSTTSIYTLAPMKYVDNMVVLFACTVFMYFEKRLCGVVKRFHFSPLYSHHILTDYRKRPQNRHVFTLHNYNTYLRSDHFGLEELPTADFLFLPFVHDDHWWCYSVKLRSMEIFVIDSLGKGIRDRKRIDTAVAENMARFFCILMNIPEGSIGPLTVKQANIPSQPNLHDCGVIMLKAMEIWDGDEKYNGKSMPEYTTEELLGIRKKYVCDWILDNENISRMEALHLYGIV
ncbi:uncharacterized protein LOC128194682 [Vigna angularis]|uniref:uncharacterized protein LOC128194682 n=2 Tax=Phaseolus angularis TaxID=3914 RepID=UPI0022B4D8C8|nr:uncharacterized protein LOC128194682 [Vigna angularis]